MNVTATKQVETKCIYTFLVIVFEAILRDCASFEYGVGQLGTSCGRNSSQFQRVWSQTGGRARRDVRTGAKRHRAKKNCHHSSPPPRGSMKRRNHQITAIHLRPYHAISLPFELLSRGTRQRGECNGSYRAKQTQRDASHECQPATPDLFLSSPLSVCLLRGEILYRPGGSSSRNTSAQVEIDRRRGGARGKEVGRGEGDRGMGVGEDRKCARLSRPHYDHGYDHAGNDDAATQDLSPDCGRPPALLPFRFSPSPTLSHMLILYFCPYIYIYNVSPSVRCSTNLFDSISWLTAPICL